MLDALSKQEQQARRMHRSTPGDIVRILLLEDVATDAELVETELRRAGLRFECLRVDERAGFVAGLETFRPDLILADYILPQFTALDALHIVREREESIPFILVTGTQTEEIAVECMRAGADDYILKGSLTRLPTAVRQALRQRAIERDKERAEADLRRSEALYRLLAENSRDLVCLLDGRGPLLYASPSCRELLGVEPQALGGVPVRRSAAVPDTSLGEALGAFLATNLANPHELLCRHASGEWRSFEAVGGWVRANGETSGAVLVLRDTTERKRAEGELRQANDELGRREQELLRTLSFLEESHRELRQTQLQLIQAAKMESVGRLAAGVAHEVKNPLTTLLMGIEYLQRHLASTADEELVLVLRDMEQAVRRGNRVILGLLDFSTPGALGLEETVLEAVITAALELVKHECRQARTRVVVESCPDLPPLRLDRNKMEQVFVNLFLNAIQAMPEGGTLRVCTRLEDVAASAESTHDAGQEAVITVEDTGQGIAPEHLPRLFDPFFTTRRTRHSTGLGLAVVEKIVDLHGASIHIGNRSEGGACVTLRFPLPRAPGAAGAG